MRGLVYLHPVLQLKAANLKQLASDRFGLNVIFTDTLRTGAEQDAYYAQGRQDVNTVNALRRLANMAPITQSANRIITRASKGSSWHEYGLAFDIAIVDPTGRKIVWDNTSDWNQDSVDDWAQVGSLGDEVGLEWGGNFTSIYDAPHYQDRMGLTIAYMKANYKPGEIAQVPYETSGSEGE